LYNPTTQRKRYDIYKPLGEYVFGRLSFAFLFYGNRKDSDSYGSDSLGNGWLKDLFKISA